MTAKTSIDPAEFLHEHLSQASPDLLRELMQGFVNTLLSADADSVCGAAYGVRDEARTNRRNGYRRRELDTRDTETGEYGAGRLDRTTLGPHLVDEAHDQRRRGSSSPAKKVAADRKIAFSSSSERTFALRSRIWVSSSLVAPARFPASI